MTEADNPIAPVTGTSVAALPSLVAPDVVSPVHNVATAARVTNPPVLTTARVHTATPDRHPAFTAQAVAATTTATAATELATNRRSVAAHTAALQAHELAAQLWSAAGSARNAAAELKQAAAHRAELTRLPHRVTK